MKVSVAAPAIDAKKHVRPASRNADMLSKPDDRSSVYYGSRCRQNPWISFLSGKIYIYYTRNMGFVKGEISLAAVGPPAPRGPGARGGGGRPARLEDCEGL